MLDWDAILQAIFAGGIGVVLVELIKGWFGRGKNRADGDKAKAEAVALISDNARQWALQADNRATKAEQRASEMLDKFDQLSTAMDDLERRIARCMGGFPCPHQPLEVVSNERNG